MKKFNFEGRNSLKRKFEGLRPLHVCCSVCQHYSKPEPMQPGECSALRILVDAEFGCLAFDPMQFPAVA